MNALFQAIENYFASFAPSDTDNFTLGGADSARVALTSSTLVTVTALDDDEEAWVYEDMGADYFNGDFEYHTQINCTSNVDADTCGLWAIANTVDTLTDIGAASGDYLAVYWIEDRGDHEIKLEECNAGVITTDTSIALSKETEYYLKIVRDESVGTYGTLYCYIYTGSIGGTLVDTLTVTLTIKQDFCYLYWMVAREAGTTGAAWSGTIQNLKRAGIYNDVSGRLYHNVADQKSTFPYCVYFSVSDIDDLDFSDEREDFLIQFNIFSQNNSAFEAGTILESLKAAFDNCNLTVTNWRHIGFQRDFVIPNNDPTQGTPIMGYSVQYNALLEKARS